MLHVYILIDIRIYAHSYTYILKHIHTFALSHLHSHNTHTQTQIYELVEVVLKSTQDRVLLEKTLDTLLCFLHWIPVGFIFETPLLQMLFTKFFGADAFQNKTLQVSVYVSVSVYV
jgi:exportin-1